MAQLRSKDYAIFSLRYYADRRVLNRLGPTAPQHMQRAKAHSEFYWKLFCHVTKKNRNEYVKAHWFFLTECVEEELEQEHGIVRQCREGTYAYYIPIENADLVKWFETNVGNVPCKRLKRSPSGFHSKSDEPRYWRNKAEAFTQEAQKNIRIRNNTRTVLIEKYNGNKRT